MSKTVSKWLKRHANYDMFFLVVWSSFAFGYLKKPETSLPFPHFYWLEVFIASVVGGTLFARAVKDMRLSVMQLHMTFLVVSFLFGLRVFLTFRFYEISGLNAAEVLASSGFIAFYLGCLMLKKEHDESHA